MIGCIQNSFKYLVSESPPKSLIIFYLEPLKNCLQAVLDWAFNTQNAFVHIDKEILDLELNKQTVKTNNDNLKLQFAVNNLKSYTE